MDKISAETVWGLSEKELLSALESGALTSRTGKISFYTPSFAFHKMVRVFPRARFPTITVTGNECALNCRYCGGKILETMLPAETPQQLFELATKLKCEGAVGCLVSGGCLSNGSVPLERFIPALKKIKRELGLTVVVHTGIVNAATARALKDAGIDAALIDVIGSDVTIKHVCNLNIMVDDYEDALRALHSVGLSFVPHVVVGLQNGELNGEFEALKMIHRHEPSALVVIAFMPMRGTEMETVNPPLPLAIARVIASARVMFPETPLALGCLRPKGKHRAETDVLTLKAGVDAIAFPTEEAVAYAENRGLDISFSSYCCSQIYVDMENSVRSLSK
jgi:uncharacterized radical SAM superfamily protein